MNFKQVKWVSTVSTGNNLFLKLLVIILIPVILAFFLVVMFFAAIISGLQTLTMSRAELQKQKEQRAILADHPLTSFATVNHLEIQHQFAGSLPGYAGDYFYLESQPDIRYFENTFFGDWFYIGYNGIFLQKINDPRNVNCDLIFVNADTLQVVELQSGIPSMNWKAEKMPSGNIRFTFSTTNGNFIYETVWPDV